MESVVTQDEIRRFLTVPGYGSGSGSGSGYGDGSGYGYGYGYGDGSGDLKKFNGEDVYYIDGIPCLFRSIKGNIAKVAVIEDDFSLTDCYVAKCGNSFGHGDSAREAYDEAEAKELEESPVGERIAKFVESHPDPDKPYGDLFSWHHILTGSCEFGRKEWCKSHGYQPTDSITVRTFIEQTKNDYGGDVISQLAKEYDL